MGSHRVHGGWHPPCCRERSRNKSEQRPRHLYRTRDKSCSLPLHVLSPSPLLSCSLPSSMRKRTRKRPPTWGSVSATSTGPPSGPHQQAIPSGVVSASKTIEGR